MKNVFLLFSIAAVTLFSCSEMEKATLPEISVDYPETKKLDQEDEYFGQVVKDPYRWLEDDNAEDTKDWVQRQNKVAFSYLEQIPFRDKMKERLTELWDYEKIGAPFKEGDYYYYFKNDGLQNQNVLYRSKEPGADGSVFFDPNELSEDGTVSLAGFSFSKEGDYFAYSISVSGSDWREIFVMDTKSMDLLEDKVQWVKFSGIAWAGDGFYYSRYPEPKKGDELKSENQYGKLYYHQLGTPQSEDQMIFEDTSDPNRRFSGSTSEDERFLVVYGSKSTSGNSLFVKDLSKANSKFLTMIDDYENDHSVVGFDKDWLYILTNYEAPNYRLMRVKADRPAIDQWETIIEEKDQVLSAGMGGGKIFASYLLDAKTSIEQYDLDGKLDRKVELPGIGSAYGFSGKEKDEEIYYTFTSFTVPTTIYKYEIASGTSELYRAPEVDFDPEAYETKQVFYTSKDGTKVPMFITHKKGLELDGNNPTMLYGYGGFNISLRPSFSVANVVWMENGGIYAVPNIRGGGEYGKSWHKAGTLMQKQNVFDDFIAAAEYLIDQKYTSSEKLAIAGGSNGGLLVGACMTQRPDLFKVALPAVGVLDMLRYQLFTIGRAWATDYGTAEDSEEMFTYLRAYSPLHNLNAGTSYPATMVTTADHDDRVVPAHSFKFAATLQERHEGEAPVLIRIETKAGHGAGKPTSKIIEERADIFSFAFFNMGIYPKAYL